MDHQGLIPELEDLLASVTAGMLLAPDDFVRELRSASGGVLRQQTVAASARYELSPRCTNFASAPLGSDSGG